MSEYLAPGVYVEEVDRGARQLAGVSTSTAGFLGPTERGPTDPRLLTSVSDFERLYGGYIEGMDLPAAVRGFFANGGRRCFVARVTAAEEPATGALLADRPEDEGAENGTAVLKVEAIGPGRWGTHVALIVSPASMQRSDESSLKLFKLTVRYWADEDDREAADDGDADVDDDVPAPDVEEVYDDLTLDERASNFVEKQVNGASALITVKVPEHGDDENDDEPVPDRPDDLVDEEGTPTDPVWLGGEFDANEDPKTSHYKGGDDGIDVPPEKRTGLLAFEQRPEISIICLPDAAGDDDLTTEVIRHCREQGDRFAIVQAEQSVKNVGDLVPPENTDVAAFYYPWLEARNPDTGLVESVPPGGHVAGIYARSDAEHGVHKAPANEVVRGVIDVGRPVTKGEQELLNPRGVNCIRSFRGRGIRVWGARTASSDPQWKYVNVRRLFLFLKESIEEGTRWVVFEPNDEELWARVRQTIRNFLTDVWEDGALMGSTPDEAFFVTCDRTTMTQSDIENGRLICEIGVAPTRPAEFVIFRISQTTVEAT